MTASAVSHPSTAEELFAPVSVDLERRGDGSAIFRSTIPLAPTARCVGEWLERWAREAPNRVFLAERGPTSSWVTVSYAEALARVRAAASWIVWQRLRRGLFGRQRLSARRPIVVLSDNGVEHALLALAGMHVGVPVATISQAYSLASTDHRILRAMISLLDPGAIYVSDVQQFAPALAAISPLHKAVVVAGSRSAHIPAGVIPFSELQRETDVKAVARAFAAVSADTIARFLFTSGSTGSPKAVINTQRMLTANQAAKAQTWPFLDRAPPVILDWLPWSHTFGANHNLNLVLRAGGSLYIDYGKPAPHLFAASIQNLREIVPTIYFNVPRGFNLLVAALEDDAALARRFFEQVKILFYAGAALPQNVWEALERLSLKSVGRRTPMVSSWGSTETAPLATDCHFQADRSGNIGVPAPGVDLKLIPSGDKLEIRVRGPNVTPGYWKAPELTAKAFDEEGFYRIGDAVKFVDPLRPEKGLLFDGRVGEDFKLTTGSWVSVGTVRVAGIECLSPLADDIVVAGHDRDEIAFLIFPNIKACRELAGLSSDIPIEQALSHARVRQAVKEGLLKLKARGGGSASYAQRALLLERPPSADLGEITDKGYINQRTVLAKRGGDVARLYDPSEPACIGCE